MRVVEACSPHSAHFLEANALSGLITAYNFDTNVIALEAPLAKVTLREKEMENIGDVLNVKFVRLIASSPKMSPSSPR